MDPARDLQQEISCLLSKLDRGHIPWAWLCFQEGQLMTGTGMLCAHAVFMEVLSCSNSPV